jgi:transposase InsO family protein
MERGWKRRLRFSYAPSIDLWQPRGEGVPAHRAREEARLAIFDYIAAFYKRTRRHSGNAYRSPDDQETQYAASVPRQLHLSSR